jgi:putative N6-adenine-specific DNA methylase
MKKAIVERLKGHYGIDWLPETGESYPLRVSIVKDKVTIGLDTTGTSLHKRGYRKATVKAPITETLASALIMLTPWKKDRILVDPFCGSGTFAIEAAMMAAGIAPGMHREFTAQSWKNLIPEYAFRDAFEEARGNVDKNIKCDIQGYDIDEGVIRAARENAKNAGVDHLIHFQKRPVSELSHSGKYGFVITNPPYGERLEDRKELPALYREIGEAFRRLDSWSEYVITSYDQAEKYIGRKADRNRKIYNGMIKTYFYQFIGPKPPAGRPGTKKDA